MKGVNQWKVQKMSPTFKMSDNIDLLVTMRVYENFINVYFQDSKKQCSVQIMCTSINCRKEIQTIFSFSLHPGKVVILIDFVTQ